MSVLKTGDELSLLFAFRRSYSIFQRKIVIDSSETNLCQSKEELPLQKLPRLT
jgi:hypothetical protein